MLSSFDAGEYPPHTIEYFRDKFCLSVIIDELLDRIGQTKYITTLDPT